MLLGNGREIFQKERVAKAIQRTGNGDREAPRKLDA
jgi:hypothetical protein